MPEIMPENPNLAQNVNDDELLNSAFNRVAKLPSPLLVIGLGGTGCDILRTIKRTFAQRFELPVDVTGELIPVPQKTAYLAIDSDRSSGTGFDVHEFVNITEPRIATYLSDHDRYLTAAEREWVHKGLLTIDPGNGAGTYRPAARLMLSCKSGDVEAAIISALRQITSVTHGGNVARGRLEIVIAAGISGGTGSGTFLDVPQIVRDAIKRDATLSAMDYKITGYLVLPDVSLSNVVDMPMMHPRIRANGFAALKELDFWMSIEKHNTPYTMEYRNGRRIKWVKPYDHCILLSGTDVDGTAFDDCYTVVQHTVAENLLHYLADENPPQGDNNATFSYINYESNLEAMVNGLNMPLPLHYGYRTIGAFAKRVPKKKLLFYEGSLLFKTFMPQRDDRGNLVPNTAMLMDGQTYTRAMNITGNIGDLYNNFATDNPYPAVFCNLDSRNQNQMNNLRTLDPAPHDYYRTNALLWDTSVIGPAAYASANAYLEQVWQNFMAQCQFIISDREQGPFSLLAYLTDPNGLLPALQGINNEWKGYASNLHLNLNPAYQACVQSFNSFVHPPLLGGARAVEAYLSNLTGLLEATRLDLFTTAYSNAMNTFVRRVEEYVRSSLQPLCDTIDELSQELVKPESLADHMSSDLFSVDLVKSTIDADFEGCNIDDKVSRSFLEKLCGLSFQCVENVDPHSCGITFTFAPDARALALTAMRDELDECFGGINGQSLDAIMAQAGKNTVQEQNEYIDQLGSSVIGSSRPLFSLGPKYPEDDDDANARYSYLSIPDDSPLHLARLETSLARQRVDPKGSSLRDHIYCTTAQDGLALYRYSQMGALELEYEQVLGSHNGAGTHLVWNGESDAPYTKNWAKLPSPRPFYLFDPQNGSPRAVKAYEEARALARRALAAGQLTLDSSLRTPKYALRVFFSDQTQTTVLHVDTIKAQYQAVLDKKDPFTGAKRSNEQILSDLEALRDQATTFVIEPLKFPGFMAGKLGLQNQKIDPFNAQVAGNPIELEQAKRNFVALCEEYAVVLLLQQPVLYTRISEQIEAFEIIAEKIKQIGDVHKVWEPRVEYAQTVAKLFAFGLIEFNRISGVNYTDASGAVQAVVNPAILSEDLNAVSPLTKVAAHLADLNPQHPMRQYLEFRLAQAENDWMTRGTQNKLTDEEIKQHVDCLTMLKTRVKKEMDAYLAEKTSNMAADLATLDNCIALLNSMELYASTEIQNLTAF